MQKAFAEGSASPRLARASRSAGTAHGEDAEDGRSKRHGPPGRISGDTFKRPERREEAGPTAPRTTQSPLRVVWPTEVDQGVGNARPVDGDAALPGSQGATRDAVAFLHDVCPIWPRLSLATCPTRSTDRSYPDTARAPSQGVVSTSTAAPAVTPASPASATTAGAIIASASRPRIHHRDPEATAGSAGPAFATGGHAGDLSLRCQETYGRRDCGGALNGHDRARDATLPLLSAREHPPSAARRADFTTGGFKAKGGTFNRGRCDDYLVTCGRHGSAVLPHARTVPSVSSTTLAEEPGGKRIRRGSPGCRLTIRYTNTTAEKGILCTITFPV